MKETFIFQINKIENKTRLDEFLFDKIGSVSRMHLRGLLLENKCAVNGKTQKGGYHLQINDSIQIEVDLSAVTSMKPEPIPLEIIFEDEEIIVVNKPAKMLVHPTRSVKSGTLLNALAFHLNQEDFSQRRKDAEKNLETKFNDQFKIQNSKSKIVRPGLIHRLDKKTSGLMVIAKTPRAHRILSKHFQKKLVEKRYFALVEGIVRKDSGTITTLIGRDEDKKHWQVSSEGKFSETYFRTVERRESETLLELEPVTGRTNQLRIHCAFLGHPIVGDTMRGGREFSRLCLHAFHLCFWHPSGEGRMKFESALPKEFM